MRKTALFFLILFLPTFFTGCATTGKVQTWEVKDEMHIPGLDRDSVFDLVTIWMADSYQANRIVIESADKKRGRISATGTASFNYLGTEQSCRYRMIVGLNDSAIAITYRDMDPYTLHGRTVMSEEVQGRIHPNLKRTTHSLYRFLSTRGASR